MTLSKSTAFPSKLDLEPRSLLRKKSTTAEEQQISSFMWALSSHPENILGQWTAGLDHKAKYPPEGNLIND